MTKLAIVIPARYASKRFPGKPLHKIAGKTMLERVYGIALKASEDIEHCQVIVATDDDRIADFAKSQNINHVMTPSSCPTGSDRVLHAVENLAEQPDYVINLQGDSPLTPPHYINKLLMYLDGQEFIDAVTIAIRLNWSELDKWREHKRTTPFSGTSVVFDDEQNAMWFSKNIIPAIRDEDKQRKSNAFSPIYRHLGIYGYSLNMLRTFVRLPQTHYEKLEGLEQLRLIENGYTMHVVEVNSTDGVETLGVDTLEDAKRVEEILANNGELA